MAPGGASVDEPCLVIVGVIGMDWNAVWDHGNGSTDLGKAGILRFRGFKTGDLSPSSSCAIVTSASAYGGV